MQKHEQNIKKKYQKNFLQSFAIWGVARRKKFKKETPPKIRPPPETFSNRPKMKNQGFIWGGEYWEAKSFFVTTFCHFDRVGLATVWNHGIMGRRKILLKVVKKRGFPPKFLHMRPICKNSGVSRAIWVASRRFWGDLGNFF